MKKYISTILSIGLASLTCQAAIVIMDANTLNGDFEDGTGETSPRKFTQVDVWVNEGTGFDFETDAAANNLGSPSGIDTGVWNAMIDDNGLDGVRIHTVATGYSLQEGDFFNVSFDWRDAFGWEDGDQAIVRLVSFSGGGTPGNNTGIAWSFTLSDTRGAGATATWRSVSGTSQTVGNFAATNGGLLYIQAFGITGPFGTEGDFARVDNIVVTAVPEPSTYALFGGLIALVCVLRRRRMK